MTEPLVSICIPTCNRASLLERSLDSILHQDYPTLEILVGDNASTDETEMLCRKLASRNSRIIYIRREKNIGIYPNHNDLINRSRGDLVAFFHDDDEFDPSLVREEVSFLMEHPNAGLVSPDWQLVDEQGRLLGQRIHPVPALQKGFHYIERTLRSGQSSVGLSGTMIRRSVLGHSRLNENGPIGFADFVLWFELAERSWVGHIPKPLYSYRLHTQSLSRRSIVSISADYRQVLEQFCDQHLARWPNHASQVRRWTRQIHRYLFWMLVYEIILHQSRRGLDKKQSPLRYRTVFEWIDYRLTEKELQEALALIRSYPGDLLERAVQQGIPFLLKMRWTWPLERLVSHTPSLRGFLGLQ